MITSSGSARLRLPARQLVDQIGIQASRGAAGAPCPRAPGVRRARRSSSCCGRFEVPVQLPPGEQPATADHAHDSRSRPRGRTRTPPASGAPPRPRSRPISRVQHRRDQRASARAPAKPRGRPELLLDPQQLVVLGQPVGARHRAGLDLAAVGGHGEIGDGGVLGLAGAMRHHAAIGGALRQLDRLQGLAQRADLIDLDQHARWRRRARCLRRGSSGW